ncbi:hypothetical protein T492DRAFT_836876 [Pavlovales sp. CCMP2436]|nr:hypothetical protein T492DRAFT_836876 [Pavlovales sp. CCMP2436]
MRLSLAGFTFAPWALALLLPCVVGFAHHPGAGRLRPARLSSRALLGLGLGLAAEPMPRLPRPPVRMTAPSPAAAATGVPLGRYARTRRLRELREALTDALVSENFELASKIKAERDWLFACDPRRDLRAQLKRAVAREDYAAASTLRDALVHAQRTSSPDKLLCLSPDGSRMWLLGADQLLDEMADAMEEAVSLQPDDLAPGTYRLQQPIWSPTSARVAATLVIPGAESELVIFDGMRGKELTRIGLPTAPFFYMWSADERYVTRSRTERPCSTPCAERRAAGGSWPTTVA